MALGGPSPMAPGLFLFLLLMLLLETSWGIRSRPPLPRCCFTKRDLGLRFARPFTLVVPLETSPIPSLITPAPRVKPKKTPTTKRPKATTTTTTNIPVIISTHFAQEDEEEEEGTLKSDLTEESTQNYNPRARKNSGTTTLPPGTVAATVVRVKPKIETTTISSAEGNRIVRANTTEAFPPKSFHILGWLLHNAKPWTSDSGIEHYPSTALNSSFLNLPNRSDKEPPVYETEYPKSNTTRRHLGQAQFARRSPFYFSVVETVSGRVASVRYQPDNKTVPELPQNRTRRQATSNRQPPVPSDWLFHLRRAAFHSLSGSTLTPTTSGTRLWRSLSRARLSPSSAGRTPDMVASGLLLRNGRGGFYFGPNPIPKGRVPPGSCMCGPDAVAYWAVRMFRMLGEEEDEYVNDSQPIFALVYVVHPLGQEATSASPAAFGYLPQQLQAQTLDQEPFSVSGLQLADSSPLRGVSPRPSATSNNNHYKGVLIEGPSGYTEEFVTLYRNVVEDHIRKNHHLKFASSGRIKVGGGKGSRRKPVSVVRGQIPDQTLQVNKVRGQQPNSHYLVPFNQDESRLRPRYPASHSTRHYLQSQLDLFVPQRPPLPNHPFSGLV